MLPGGFFALQHRSHAKSSQANSLFCIRMKKIANNQKSVAIRITLESNETLTEEIISTKINKILKSLEYRFGITLRS